MRNEKVLENSDDFVKTTIDKTQREKYFSI